MRISIPDTLISNPVLVTRTQNNIADQIAAIPGVTDVAFARALPMEGDDPNWDELFVEGKNYQGAEPPLMMYNYVSPGFFHAMGTRIVAGHDFTWSDLYDLRPRVMVNENFARDPGDRPRPLSASAFDSSPIRPGRKSSASSRTSAFMAPTKVRLPLFTGRRCSTIRTPRRRPLPRPTL